VTMRWALQLAVMLAVPLSLLAAVWGGVRLLRWTRANRARAAAAGADVLIGEQLGDLHRGRTGPAGADVLPGEPLGGFRAWLADRVDHLSGSDSSDAPGAADGGDCGDGGDSGGGCSD
jgi:hypothetical protein